MNLRISHLLDISLIVLISALFIGCSKKNDPAITEPPGKASIKGAVEKGPFVRGSIVTISELNAALAPTGRTFKTEIQDDKGNFALDKVELVSGYVQVSVNGYYFNEVNGKLSTSQINLNAIAEIGVDKRINVNVLTHLEEKRVKLLMKKEQKSFVAAKKQAMTEIYKAFSVKPLVTTNSESISLATNDEQSNILLGISAALLNISDSDNAKLTELLNQISYDIEEDGAVETTLAQVIRKGLETLNPENISLNIKARYKELNTTVSDFAIRSAFTIEFKGSQSEVTKDVFSNEKSFLQLHNDLLIRTITLSEQYLFLEGLYSKTIPGFPQHDFYLHKVTAGNRDAHDLFKAIYRNLVLTNTIVSQAEKSSTPNIKIFKNKTYPYFAYQYWMLMNLWGNPVYIDSKDLENISSYPGQMDKGQLSTLLLAGLEESISNLSAHANDANVARVIAARIAVDNQDYQTARKYLNQLIEGKKYTLANKAQIHTTANEQIFGINYNEYADLKPTNYDAYGKGGYRNLIRYTEVILLASESNFKLNNQTEAVALLNQVRVRNGKAAIASTEPGILSFIHDEMKEEFKNEGTYFAFLKRHNLSESSLGIESYQKILPMPRDEISLNGKIVQNPGY